MTSIGKEPILDRSGRHSLVVEAVREYQEIERLERRQAALARLGQIALDGADLPRLYIEATALVAETLPAPRCALWSQMPQDDRYVLAAGVGWPVEAMGEATARADDGSLVGYILGTGEPVCIQEAQDDERLIGSHPLCPDMVSGVGVLVGRRDRPYGVLAACADAPRAFPPAQLSFLQGVAHILALAADRKPGSPLQTASPDAIAERQERFRIISELTADYAYGVRVETDGRLTTEWLSDDFAQMSGYTLDEINAREGWRQIIHPDDLPIVIGYLNAHLAGRQERAEYRIATKSGEVRWIRSHGQAVRDVPEGRIVRIVNALQDVTEQKRTEAALRERERFLALLNDVTRTALEMPDSTAMLRALADELGEMFGADACYLTLWDERTRSVLPKAAYGATREYYDTLRPDPGETTITESVLRAGRPLVIEDVYDSPCLSARIARLFPDRSVLGLPLIAGEQKLGAALIAFSEPHSFSADEIARGEQVARQIALSVSKVRLLEAERVARERIESLYHVARSVLAIETVPTLLRTVTDSVAEALPADRVILITMDVEAKRVTHFVSGGIIHDPTDTLSYEQLMEGLTGWVLNERKPAFSPMDQPDPREGPDAQQRRIDTECGDVIVVPLYYRERALGTLTALNRADSRRLGPQEVELVVAMGNQVAIAIETARLYEQARLDAETKATLLREVNHRVKNNLTSIVGLLYAKRRHQALRDRPLDQETLNDLISQVQGLATVHTMLSATEWSPLQLSELAWQIIHASLRVLPSGRRVSTHVFDSPVRVSPRQANGLALVINELVTNTIKYGIGERRTASVSVRVSLEPGEDAPTVRFEYRDDGPGYPEQVLRGEQENVGLYLVRTIVRDELRGELAIANDGGAVTQVIFEAIA